jgi:glutamate synthase domain-containing protein 2
MGFVKRPKFSIDRDQDRCIDCGVCARQCVNEVHYVDEDSQEVKCDATDCCNCQRCVELCPTGALAVRKAPQDACGTDSWSVDDIRAIQAQAQSGGILLTGMGCDRQMPSYFDRMMLNASQVTNPSIDPLREPMELRTFLGRKPLSLELDESGNPKELPPQLEIELPIMFSAISFGAVSLNTIKSLAAAAESENTFYNTGEGDLHKDLYRYGKNTITQVASGRFGVNIDYLNAGAAIEIKIGQGAKPGIGGHLPGEKVGRDVAETRMIPEGSDAISPAPHHDIYSIEDLTQLIFSLKEATEYTKPISVKIAAVHNVAAIASGIARAGADIIAIDGYRGGTGATPLRTRDHVGIRHVVSIVVGGGIRHSADVVKAIALGADAVYIGTAALISLGCHVCQKCYTGKCNWGIATQTPNLVKRLNPEMGAERAANLLRAWKHEIKELLGGMGINAIESLRGNRLMLRGVGMSDNELRILGIRAAGE